MFVQHKDVSFDGPKVSFKQNGISLHLGGMYIVEKYPHVNLNKSF